jgi:hypothetical protein
VDAVLALLAWRGRVIFRLGIRPVPRRSIFPLTPPVPCVKIARRDGASSFIKPPPPLGFILAFIIRFGLETLTALLFRLCLCG